MTVSSFSQSPLSFASDERQGMYSRLVKNIIYYFPQKAIIKNTSAYLPLIRTLFYNRRCAVCGNGLATNTVFLKKGADLTKSAPQVRVILLEAPVLRDSSSRQAQIPLLWRQPARLQRTHTLCLRLRSSSLRGNRSRRTFRFRRKPPRLT